MVSSFHTSQHEEKCDHPLKAISRLNETYSALDNYPWDASNPRGHCSPLEGFQFYYLSPKQSNIQIYLLRKLKNKLPLQIFELRNTKWLRRTLELCLIPFIRLQD